MKRYLWGRVQSFKHAFSGLFLVFQTQHNIFIHCLATICVLILGLWLKLEQVEWVLLFLTFSTVWVTEFINTALETAVDLSSPDFHPLAKKAKDIGAASVLVAAFFSIIIGVLILVPPLVNRITSIF